MLAIFRRFSELFTLSDVIALGALLIALPSFVDLVIRRVTVAEIRLLSPDQVNFRTKDYKQVRNDKGERMSHPDDGSPAIADATADLPTYAILPLSYINRSDAGEDFLISQEQLSVKIGSTSFTYDAAYTTALVPRRSASWIGETMPRLPAVLSGGRARSDEVVFVPSGDPISWDDYLKILTNNRGGMIEIMLEVKTFSGKSFQSSPCKLSVDRLLEPQEKAKSDRKRHYYVQGRCEGEPPKI